MKNILRPWTKKKTVWTAIVIVVVVVVIVIAARSGSSKYSLVPVTQGSITETVSVTGNTTPVQSLDLGFQSTGRIATVNYQVGDHVNDGDVVASLDTSALQAQLAQAQAQVASAQAQLANLQAGSQPADIQSSQAALAEGQQNLANMYGNVPSTLTAAYAAANDAVRNQLSPFFTAAETNNPQLTFSVSNSQTANDIVQERLEASVQLNGWAGVLNSLTPSSPTSTLESALQDGLSRLGTIATLLNTASQAVIQATGISASTTAQYKGDITSAVNEENTATTDVNTLAQNIASQKITVQQLQAQLNLKLAGSTPQAIQAQQANVQAAQANVQGIQVQIAQASLVSPISGVITEQDAKVGEIASPNQTLVSIISDNNLEVDAYVPETDIGKVNVNDPVEMTLDAFPGETFDGKVFYIDPAQTLVGGVVDYKIKVSFDTPDSRIKSGLTVNLNIETQTDTNALILPQFAVIQNDSGTFVEVLKNGTPMEVPVTLGIQDASGNVEIASGVTAGEQVVNIGLKTQ